MASVLKKNKTKKTGHFNSYRMNISISTLRHQIKFQLSSKNKKLNKHKFTLHTHTAMNMI